MKAIGAYQPALNQTVTLSLTLQTGFTEVINDSNTAITINIAGGQVIQPPGIAQIYPTPPGGGAFTISTNYFAFDENQSLPGDNYLITDLGPAQLITVNQYEENELVGRTYPYAVIRSVLAAINTFGASETSVEGTLSATLTATMQGTGTTGTLYLQGIDVVVDQESTAHGYTLTYGVLNQGDTVTIPFHSTTAGTFQYYRQFQPGLPSQKTGANAIWNASIAAVSGATARASITIWGAFQ